MTKSTNFYEKDLEMIKNIFVISVKIKVMKDFAKIKVLVCLEEAMGDL